MADLLIDLQSVTFRDWQLLAYGIVLLVIYIYLALGWRRRKK